VINARVAMRPRKLYHQRIIVITQRGGSRVVPPARYRCCCAAAAAARESAREGRRGGDGERGGEAKNLAIRAVRSVIIPRVVNVIVRVQIASRAKQLIEA